MTRVRIIERSGLEASLMRLESWWSGLSRRERIMVGTLGTLIAALILIYGVIKPLQAARADARSDIRAYETLLARMRAAGTLVVNPPAAPAGTPRQIIARAAARAGVAISVASDGAPLTASASGVPYDGVVNWLAGAAQGGLAVTDAQIVKANAPGRVDVRVTFAS
ncbi:type II secretion system protein M [Stakelama sp. CBK3Z-3]|uniref:Type II secretion system protein M n=1 Tax=Stakelama flava TaxID=2860338 RepID=A0ABS6XJB9_9SPHN|nr:type II secretion system protein GspM [Stakelama flava]MBW4330314.1 type II secretion system protein M [Stakelama flava]